MMIIHLVIHYVIITRDFEMSRDVPSESFPGPQIKNVNDDCELLSVELERRVVNANVCYPDLVLFAKMCIYPTTAKLIKVMVGCLILFSSILNSICARSTTVTGTAQGRM